MWVAGVELDACLECGQVLLVTLENDTPAKSLWRVKVFRHSSVAMSKGVESFDVIVVVCLGISERAE